MNEQRGAPGLTEPGQMLQDAYEILNAFESDIRAGARGDLDEEGQDAARTTMGHVLDEMAHALGDERQRMTALESALQGAIYDLQYIANEDPRTVSDADRLATARAAWRTRQGQLADADRPRQRGEGGSDGN